MTVRRTHSVRIGSKPARMTLAYLMLGMTLVGTAARADTCRVASEQGQMTFPVDRLGSASRCLVFSVADNQTTSPDGHQAMDTSLIAYTKLTDPVLSGLVLVLRPLVGDAVTRKLPRSFDVTNQLGAAIAQNQDRIIQELPALPSIAPQEQQTLTALLQALLSSNLSVPRPTP